MSQRVQVHVECDPCQADDSNKLVEARSRRIVIDGKAYEIDVCKSHGREIDELEMMLQTLARPTRMTGKEAPPSAAVCPACGEAFRNKSSLQGHTRHAHDQTLEELLGTATHKCTESDCSRAFGTPQGLALHLQRTHGKSKVAA